MLNCSTLAISCEELTHWKRLWCWEGLGAGGDGDDKGWDAWMASLTRWTWVWVNSGSWWWTGRPGVLWFMGSQRVGHDWAAELNWTEINHVPIMACNCNYFYFLSGYWLWKLVNTFYIVTITAAAKSLQSCPTLCDAIDGSPPGSAIPGILQTRILEWL